MHREVPICLRRLQLPTRIQKIKAQFLNSPVPRCQIRGGSSSLTTRARTELGFREAGVGGFHPPSCYKFMCTRERFSSTDQMIECDLYMRKSLKGGGKIYPPLTPETPTQSERGLTCMLCPKPKRTTKRASGLSPPARTVHIVWTTCNRLYYCTF